MNQNILEVLRSRLLERTSFETLPESVWKRSAALNTWGTNAIEGNTITWVEAEKILLKERSVDKKPIRDVIETIQHERTFRALLRRVKSEITLETVLELHEGVFRNIHYDAGQWRRVNVRIRGSSITPPRMEKVLKEMEKWVKKYRQQDIEGLDTFKLGAWMHYTFEWIHPCGLKGIDVTSMKQELSREVSMHEAREVVKTQMEALFQIQFEATPLALLNAVLETSR